MSMTISGTNGVTFPSGYTQADIGIGSSNTGQTWQNVTASRAKNTTYTNSTGRPIFVQAWSGGGATGDIYMTVNGLQMWIGFIITGQTDGGGGLIVPPGGTYSLQMSANIAGWYELR